MTDHPVYVYGVIRADHPFPAGCTGIGAPPAPARTLRAGALAAVVSAAPDELLARRRDLLAHQNLLLALAEEGPVLPMRFGVVAPEESAVADQLTRFEARYLDTLARLAGRLEMNLKVFPAEEALPELLRADPALRRLREAARRRPGYEASLRLGEAVAGALTAAATRAAGLVTRRVAPFAEAAVPGPEVPGCVRNTSFLVPRGALDAFRAAASAGMEPAARADVRLTGPLPCFSFVPAEGRAATAAAGRA
ncbi:GvpL/GvpF family gas vesicle protein [Streptomyces sp. MP131-18]|uniref:GvpL/GvpF family gas vesicle protein n=1 Tax=Streptomyces sp. MP131-18 TaxID=1857892 RepID=UPI00097BEF33|nr:GvpL/GvpF family gas vesicle protein [Streptomyces sp. MP131-18]ONK11159.1 Gas vesicle synthesis protein GvpL/GvpF [Streptomyces sp. MP131-18]